MALSDTFELSTASGVSSVPTATLQRIHNLIADDLLRGRDAWPAVNWLAATDDTVAKKRLYDELTAIVEGASSRLLEVDGAVDNFGSEIVFGRAARARRQLSRAFDFASTLRDAIPGEGEEFSVDLGFEVIVEQRREEAKVHEDRTEALQRLGVEPGKGLPFFELYMQRRSKRNWSASHGSHR